MTDGIKSSNPKRKFHCKSGVKELMASISMKVLCVIGRGELSSCIALNLPAIISMVGNSSLGYQFFDHDFFKNVLSY